MSCPQYKEAPACQKCGEITHVKRIDHSFYNKCNSCDFQRILNDDEMHDFRSFVDSPNGSELREDFYKRYFELFLKKATAICDIVDGKKVYSSIDNVLNYVNVILKHFKELSVLYMESWFSFGITQIDFTPETNELRLYIDIDYCSSLRENDQEEFDYVRFTTAFENATLTGVFFRKDIDSISFAYTPDPDLNE